MKLLIIILLALSISACSIFKGSEKDEQTENDKVEEVYIFDEVSEDTNTDEDVKSLKNEVDNAFNTTNEENTNISHQDINKTPTNTNENLYEGNVFYLQLGAFTTLKRAEQFVSEINSKVPFQLSIIFNSKNSLYTVRSSPYATKSEVSALRDEFWKNNLFLDSFIVTE